MKTCYVFDVDGTLTQSRQKIEDHHKVIFKNFCKKNIVYLLTGSDHQKTKEQLGCITNTIKGSYQCGGNEYWINDKLVTTEGPFVLNNELNKFWKNKLNNSKFPLRTGMHEDYRSGLVNLSIVGRGATLGERKLYEKWDKEHNEREEIANDLNLLFPDYKAQVAGKTGIDVFELGKDKGQVYSRLKTIYKQIIFFGDDCQESGNDYPFAVQLKDNDKLFHVSGPDETFRIIDESL